MPYKREEVQFCGETKQVVRRIAGKNRDPWLPPASKDEVDASLRLCSACHALPQVLHCSWVTRYAAQGATKSGQKEDTYCAIGFCEYHDEIPREVYPHDPWLCHRHRPKTQLELV